MLNALAVMQVLVFSNGRRVLTDLDSMEAVDVCEREREDFYMLPSGSFRRKNFILDLEPVPGSPYDLYVRFGDGSDDQPGVEESEVFAFDVVYDRLERVRPKLKRRKPLPTYHHKRWGHGNSRELINAVGQFAHLAAG